MGPSQVYADGEVDVPADEALARVDSWLVDGHHLRRDVLRSGHGEWSKRSGLVGVTVRTIRNATGEGRLGDFERVSAAASDAGSGRWSGSRSTEPPIDDSPAEPEPSLPSVG